jgi:general secretion pathway protein G
MVVIVIIGLLAGAVTISVRSYLVAGKQNIARMEIAKVAQALDTFYSAHDRYPSSEEGLEILVEGCDKFPDGLLTKLPKDPWGHAYEYMQPGPSGPYLVVSYGADHREGGDGADQDLSSDELDASSSL